MKRLLKLLVIGFLAFFFLILFFSATGCGGYSYRRGPVYYNPFQRALDVERYYQHHPPGYQFYGHSYGHCPY